MSVWVENPPDDGSAVWGCEECSLGAWCSDHTSARLEARMHATGHGSKVVHILDRQHGPTANSKRDAKIHRLRADGLTIRAIAAKVGLSTAGVIKALRRQKEPA